jgi:non-specific serine/threonine protein kinase/serine/threonine-protein kinase
MDAERWQRINTLYHAALERDTAQRAVFLHDACAGDDELREEVESLIAAHHKAAAFIQRPAFASALRLLAGDEPAGEGQQIGPYQVIREIGRGGMGVVYLARRADDYEKHVAIKLIKRGMDTDFILRRFRHERQILAGLDHPYIARLLDGGTTADGLPYFVMEHIEGQPINEYADARCLSIDDRLKLFRKVCAAVQYAHQNLVIHRDIKPGNILVTSGGVPKLLDFGIAKLLTPEASADATATATALCLMTPEYASPEQVRGERATTASDVYSLGVVLYELLSGHSPYCLKSRSPQEIARIISEVEPERPSTAVNRIEETAGDGCGQTTRAARPISAARESSPEKLRRRLRGDLDNIVLMAMRKEPARRYVSVQQFSEDIRRHLKGLPVIARADTLSYRSLKFIQRHQAAVATSALISLLLVGGIMATAWQAHQAKRAQARAEQRFNEVRKLAKAVIFDYHDAIEDLPGSTPVRARLVKDALEYLDSLAAEAGDDPALQRELARAYLRIGDIQGRPFFPNLGDTAGAKESYQKLLAISERLVAADPANADTLFTLWSGHNRIGSMLRLSGDMAGATSHFRQCLAIAETLSAADPANVDARHNLLISHYFLGDMMGQSGDAAQALEHYRKGLEIAESLVAAHPEDKELRRKEAIGHLRIGDILHDTGDAAQALEHYRKTLAINEALAAADPVNARLRRDLYVAHLKISQALAETGDAAKALAYARQSFSIAASLAAADPTNSLARADLANAHNTMARALARAGEQSAALESYRKAVAIRQQLVALDPSNIDHRDAVAGLYASMGDALAQAGRTDAALESYRSAQEGYEALAAASQASASLRHDLAEIYRRLGDLRRRMATEAKTPASARTENWREARAWYQRSLAIWLDMRSKNALSPADASKPEDLARRIAQCDEALRDY